MGLLDKLWDDVLAGPQPDKGLKKLRKERLAAGLSDVFQDGTFHSCCLYFLVFGMRCKVKRLVLWCPGVRSVRLGEVRSVGDLV